MSTGRAYAKKMDQAIAKLGHDHDAKAAELDALNRQSTENRRAISKAYMAIAKDHVAALDAQELQAYDQVTEEAAFRIRARLHEISQLKATLQKRLADEELAAGWQADAVARRDQDAGKVSALEQAVDEDLETQDSYQELRAAAAAASDVARRAMEKARRATEEGSMKAHAYEADAIFTYLHRREFGEQGYRRRAPHLVRVIDGWLAKLCGYATASKDYQTLTTMPSYLSAHAEKMQLAANVSADRSGTFRREALKTAGVDALIEALHESARHLVDQDVKLDAAREALDSTRLALRQLEEWRDEASASLLQRMAAVFSQESFEKLRGRVGSTSTGNDDANLGRIETWLGEVKDTEVRAADVRAYIQSINDRTKALVDLRRQYKQKGYDSSDYKMSGGKVDDLLTGYILGTVIGSDLWRGISTSVRYDPPYTPSTSSSRSSSSGGGGFRSGGSFGGGGGGFRTGGGF